MEENLSNFTADEIIRYEFIGRGDDRSDYRTGTFEYLAVLTPMGWGPPVEETRTPVKGTQLFPASGRDTGLPGLAFIFLPTVQSDYDMKCEGESERNGRPAAGRTSGPPLVLHRQLRRAHVAKVKGRAWISADSAYVVHLENALMQGIPGTGVRDSWFSIDYGPVQFHSQNVSVWLP